MPGAAYCRRGFRTLVTGRRAYRSPPKGWTVVSSYRGDRPDHSAYRSAPACRRPGGR